MFLSHHPHLKRRNGVRLGWCALPRCPWGLHCPSIGEGHCRSTEGPLPRVCAWCEVSTAGHTTGCGYTLEDTAFLVRSLTRALPRSRASVAIERVIMRDWLTGPEAEGAQNPPSASWRPRTGGDVAAGSQWRKSQPSPRAREPGQKVGVSAQAGGADPSPSACWLCWAPSGLAMPVASGRPVS